MCEAKVIPYKYGTQHPTLLPYDQAYRGEVQFIGKSAQRISPFTGLLETYNLYTHKKWCSHNASSPTIEQFKARLDQEYLTQNVDGWCEEAVIVQYLLYDEVQVWSYAVAKETATSKRTGQLIAIIGWIIIAIAIICLTTVILYFMWIMYTFGNAIMERVAPDYKYYDDQGGTHDTLAETVTANRQWYWLVCPVCAMGFAPKSSYPNYEDIPPEEWDKYTQHVNQCKGLKEEPPGGAYYMLIVWAALGIAGVIGGIWLLGKIFGKEKPIIMVK